MSHGAVKQCE